MKYNSNYKNWHNNQKNKRITGTWLKPFSPPYETSTTFIIFACNLYYKQK